MYIRENDTPEKKDFRENGLPKVPLTESILVPAIKELLHDAMLQTLRAEIEVYKAFPKNNAKLDLKRFDPTNPKTCFMGLGFGQRNSDWSDADLRDYRKAVGTINHAEWGECTMLEIWGADHYQNHNAMVTGVFKYCYGLRKTLPILEFHSIPFIITELTGTMTYDESDKEVAKNQYLMSVNGLKTTQFGGEPYPDYDSLSDGLKQDFEDQWESKNK